MKRYIFKGYFNVHIVIFSVYTENGSYKNHYLGIPTFFYWKVELLYLVGTIANILACCYSW